MKRADVPWDNVADMDDTEHENNITGVSIAIKCEIYMLNKQDSFIHGDQTALKDSYQHSATMSFHEFTPAENQYYGKQEPHI